MRAVQVKEFGGPEVLEVGEMPTPRPDSAEVVVDVEVADVMFLDTRLRGGWGRDFFPLSLPYVPGGAIGGVVSVVGTEVDPRWLGKRVVTQTAASGVGGGLPIGGYAEQALAKADTLVEIETGLSTEQAVALAHDGRTGLAVFDRAALTPGRRVLITAAAGGLGTLLTQLAVAAGAEVVAAARGAEKLALARRLGASAVVDYSVDGWAEQVREITGGGADVVFDGAGGAIGGNALTATADKGLFLGYGSAAGDFAQVDAESAAARGVSVLGLFDIVGGEVDWQALARRAQREVADGRVEVIVGQTFPLDRVAAAHAAIENRSALGRTLLTIGASL
ncbi:NADPH:quinone reductase [Nocardia neocaledoniensis NBRC 108232]|uniref:NADPH:quinone reductase-like Zn-dependent oxidoreductase n=1 Tax=Nocardia neocaledoniensis TaxID=236511 RepID=A0A317N723_9NOCA|nr:zinc-binding dehydrogenase [Nocardia neocaledoniensis]PWV71116.1 NADPH:quinone reductase-like Zn-dependent oxidoreductase [Nocardia neocaledoniensis]GEM30222.1 NADPH:quinone reductase [Nocardia neocaledoniensis NBRC 108232]